MQISASLPSILYARGKICAIASNSVHARREGNIWFARLRSSKSIWGHLLTRLQRLQIWVGCLKASRELFFFSISEFKFVSSSFLFLSQWDVIDQIIYHYILSSSHPSFFSQTSRIRHCKYQTWAKRAPQLASILFLTRFSSFFRDILFSLLFFWSAINRKCSETQSYEKKFDSTHLICSLPLPSLSNIIK